MLRVEWNQSLHRETKGKPWSHLFIPLENRSSPCLTYGLLNLKKPFQNWLKKLEKSKNIFKELESNSWRCRLGQHPEPMQLASAYAGHADTPAPAGGGHVPPTWLGVACKVLGINPSIFLDLDAYSKSNMLGFS